MEQQSKMEWQAVSKPTSWGVWSSTDDEMTFLHITSRNKCSVPLPDLQSYQEQKDRVAKGI